MVELTIGVVASRNLDGVYFTLQALRLYQDLRDTELLVVDRYGCEQTQAFVENWAKGRYLRATDAVGDAAARDLVFREAAGPAVLCCDAHALFAPGVIARLQEYYRQHPGCSDLLQGPLVFDDLLHVATHLAPEWEEQRWGTPATDPRGLDPAAAPFGISMQRLGAFSCRTEAWPGVDPAFRGSGGDEGYLHEKVRRAGGRCLCLPWFRWTHRVGPTGPASAPLVAEDALRNYLIGHTELGFDPAPVFKHFAEHLPEDRVTAIAVETLWGSTEGTAPGGETGTSAAALPLVSCLCATYNRPPASQHLLEEAVESFLRQTYPNKELIVLNDCPTQELVCDAPGVRVVNLPERFPSLGDKWNAAVALAQGDLLAPWNDDDISLPWRLSLSVERLGDAGYFNPRCYWFWDPNGLHFDHTMGYAHNASLFTRTAFETVGGYPSISLGEDAVIDGAFFSQIDLAADPRRGLPPLTTSEWFYIYRWGVNPVHVSSRREESFYQDIGALPVESGRFHLFPHWRKDYAAATRRTLAAAAGAEAHG